MLYAFITKELFYIASYKSTLTIINYYLFNLAYLKALLEILYLLQAKIILVLLIQSDLCRAAGTLKTEHTSFNY